MYKICKTERSFARQRQLEEGILNFLEEVSFFDLEIADLCRYLSIPRKTFYRYFGSKEDALYALVDHRLYDMELFVSDQLPNGTGTPSEHALHFFQYWKKQYRFLDVMQKNLLLGVIAIRAVALHTGTPSADMPSAAQPQSSSAFVSNFYISGLMSMMFQWYTSGFGMDIRELARLAGTLTDTPLCRLEFQRD